MRSIWRGEVSFGLVSVPVKLYTATEDHDLKSHMVDAEDGTRIRYKRVREGTDKEVEYSDIGRAYESDDGETVILTRDELSELPAEQDHLIDVAEFVPAEEVNPIVYAKSYFLEPAAKNAKAYVLLRRALEASDLLAIATFTLRGRTRLAALRVYEKVILLHTLLWPDEVRDSADVQPESEPRIRKQELEMATSLIDTMTTSYDPSRYTDDYREQLHQLVESKAEGGDSVQPPEPDSSTDDDDDDDVDDLLAALRASVEDRKSAKKSSGQSSKRSSGGGSTKASGKSSGKGSKKKSAS